MDVLVETHDEEEMGRALKIQPKIIGVNNRNLKDFTISLENTKRLRPMVPEGTVFVSESGVTTNEHIAFLKECKVDALLLVVHLCYRNIQENLQQNGRTYITKSKRIKHKAVKKQI